MGVKFTHSAIILEGPRLKYKYYLHTLKGIVTFTLSERRTLEK